MGSGPSVAPQTTIRPVAPAEASERFQVASPTCSTTTSAPPPVSSRTRAGTSSVSWFSGLVGAELAGPLELRVARRGDDRPAAERLRDRERRRRDAAADPPDQHPLARLEARLGHEHPVGGLEDERERAASSNESSSGIGWTALRGHGDELGVRPVAVLAEDLDPARRARARG